MTSRSVGGRVGENDVPPRETMFRSETMFRTVQVLWLRTQMATAMHTMIINTTRLRPYPTNLPQAVNMLSNHDA